MIAMENHSEFIIEQYVSDIFSEHNTHWLLLILICWWASTPGSISTSQLILIPLIAAEKKSVIRRQMVEKVHRKYIKNIMLHNASQTLKGSLFHLVADVVVVHVGLCAMPRRGSGEPWWPCCGRHHRVETPSLCLQVLPRYGYLVHKNPQIYSSKKFNNQFKAWL